jgi:parvulin-like peptidyl-prolyl isomerase
MKKKFTKALITLFIAAAVSACSGEGKPDSPVIARVNKEVITQNQFLREASRVPEWARGQLQKEEGRERFLDEMIKRELIYQYAKKMRLNKDPEFKERMKEFEKMTLVSLVLKKEVDDKVRVDDEEVKAFFEENKDKLTIGSQLRASHILVKTAEEAESILKELKDGASFEKLARKYSLDKTSAEKGGDLGFFGRGKMVPEFERAALSLKIGEISKPVRSRFGYHIIKLTDVKKGKPASFEQSRESIRRELINQKRKKLFDAFVERLKADSNITKDEVALNAITLQGGEKQAAEAPEGK